jgi:hypothetical protein
MQRPTGRRAGFTSRCLLPRTLLCLFMPQIFQNSRPRLSMHRHKPCFMQLCRYRLRASAGTSVWYLRGKNELLTLSGVSLYR